MYVDIEMVLLFTATGFSLLLGIWLQCFYRSFRNWRL